MNGREQIRPAFQDPLRAGLQLGRRPHRQREESQKWIEIDLLAKLLQAQPHHAIHKRLKLLRQLIRAKPEAPVRHQHHHSQVQHLRVQLEEAVSRHRKLSQFSVSLDTPEGRLDDLIEAAKARIRAKGEHPFCVINWQFGFQKTRSRCMHKNSCKVKVLVALANLFMARHLLLCKT